ncbi:MAG TPA: DUF6662 family protein [Burkholderiales bacterium]
MKYRASRITLLAAVLGCLSSPAIADEPLFGYTTLVDTLPKGGKEVEFWMTHRYDKGAGTYRAYDYRLEFEYGFTDRFMGSFYLNARQHDISDVPGFDNIDQFRFDGASAEAKYQILSPYKDDFGLGLYGELTYGQIDKISGESNREWEFETKLLLQKNFMEDQLIWAGNVILEVAREHAAGEEAELELKGSLVTGLSYRFAPGWYGGLEARYESIWPGEGQREAWALFLGPTLHYGAKSWWATLTWLPQVSGKPHDDALSSSLTLEEFEKNEIRLRVGFPF